MREIKTITSDGAEHYMPYSQNAVDVLQTTNKYGAEKQKMSVFVVDAIERNTEGLVVKEKVVETIYQLQQHKGLTANQSANKERELSEKELELQIKENRLAKLEKELNLKQEKVKNTTTK